MIIGEVHLQQNKNKNKIVTQYIHTGHLKKKSEYLKKSKIKYIHHYLFL